MSVVILQYVAFLLAAAVGLSLLANAKHRGRRQPPAVPGLPVLGNTLQLRAKGVQFISECRQAHGDAFTLNLAGQRMVWLFRPQHISYFFTAPASELTFKPATERFTQRVFGLPPKQFSDKHEQLLGTFRSLLAPGVMQQHAQTLAGLAVPHLDEWAHQGQVELWRAVKTLVFQAGGRTLFGSPFFDRHGPGIVQDTFFTFEEGFEMAASPIPHVFQPKFTHARKALLAMLRSSVTAGDFEAAPIGSLLQGCGLPVELHPNLLLTMLWASQSNSVAALFWVLAYLLLPGNAHHLTAVLEELQTEVASTRANPQASDGAAPGVSAAVRLCLSRRSAAGRCMAEAIRLQTMSIIVRFAAKDVVLPGRCDGDEQSKGDMLLPRGAVVALCPYESHCDQRLFPGGADPSVFDPARPAMVLGDGTAVAPTVSGMAFGGGFWRCPGRFFAEAEMSLLLLLVLQHLVLEPLPAEAKEASLPQAELRRLVGVKVPMQPWPVRVHCRGCAE